MNSAVSASFTPRGRATTDARGGPPYGFSRSDSSRSVTTREPSSRYRSTPAPRWRPTGPSTSPSRRLENRDNQRHAERERPGKPLLGGSDPLWCLMPHEKGSQGSNRTERCESGDLAQCVVDGDEH